jgi:hypothetical protein
MKLQPTKATQCRRKIIISTTPLKGQYAGGCVSVLELTGPSGTQRNSGCRATVLPETQSRLVKRLRLDVLA